MEEASSTLAYAENIRYLHSISIRTLEKHVRMSRRMSRLRVPSRLTDGRIGETATRGKKSSFDIS